MIRAIKRALTVVATTSSSVVDIGCCSGGALARWGAANGVARPDIVIANQFFHHFTYSALDDHVPILLRHTHALVVSDLHRSPVAHWGVGIIARLLNASPLSLHDRLKHKARVQAPRVGRVSGTPTARIDRMVLSIPLRLDAWRDCVERGVERAIATM